MFNIQDWYPIKSFVNTRRKKVDFRTGVKSVLLGTHNIQYNDVMKGCTWPKNWRGHKVVFISREDTIKLNRQSVALENWPVAISKKHKKHQDQRDEIYETF